MKSTLMLAMAVVMVLGSVKAMAASSYEEEGSGVCGDCQIQDHSIAAQADQIVVMATKIMQYQDEVNTDGSSSQSRDLGKIVGAADMVMAEVQNTENIDKLNAAWIEMKNLRDSACRIARGAQSAECKVK